MGAFSNVHDKEQTFITFDIFSKICSDSVTVAEFQFQHVMLDNSPIFIVLL